MDTNKKLGVIFVICLTLTIPNTNANICDGVTQNNDCIRGRQCSGQGQSLEIWEDCEVGSTLLTGAASQFNEPIDCDNFLEVSADKSQLKLKSPVDAENPKAYETCKFDATSTIDQFVFFLDVNEYEPQPEDGLRVQEISFAEGQPDKTDVVTFTYVDEDKDEQDNLKYEWQSDEFQDTFELTQSGNSFTLSTKKSLDYETRSVYKLIFEIKSSDERGDVLSNNHTLLIFVEDIGDTAPYWLLRPPDARIIEGLKDREVYRVEAADRDFDIGNDVQYSITSGNDEGFFAVNSKTGIVTLTQDIDHETDTNFFTIEITAQEIDSEGEPAPDPSSDTVKTNVYIDDDNDEIPTFSQESYKVDMDEFVDGEFFINVDIFVCDADSDPSFNRYTVTSDQAKYLEVVPNDPSGNTTIQLKVLDVTDTIFDYETQEEPIVITLTATENKDKTHTDTAQLTITLIDRNDHKPQFEDGPYTATIPEDEGQGFSVVNVTATDQDRSKEFGTESLKYYVDCPNILDIDELSGEITLASDNALDYDAEDGKEVECSVYVEDNLSGALAKRTTTTITITVEDVNDSPPTITVDKIGSIMENSKQGTDLRVKIEASDRDTNPELNIDIDWDSSKAFKDSNPVSIDKAQEWFIVEVSDITTSPVTATLKIGNESPDREIIDSVTLSIKVVDQNTASSELTVDHDEESITISILDENDSDPKFEGDYSNLRVTENAPGGTEIGTINTSDEDQDDEVSYTISDDTYLNVKQIGSNFSCLLVVSEGAKIDRETNSSLTVTVTATDGNNHQTSQEFVVFVDDENDEAPTFAEETLFASFTSNDKIKAALLTFQAFDVDLNEDLMYTSLNDYTWYNGGPTEPAEIPFQITNSDGNGTLTLNFNPVGIKNGFCNFTIECLDRDGIHSATVEAKVFAIGSDFQISAFYDNALATTQARQIDIQAIFSSVYGYPCLIDQLEEGVDATKSVAVMHFIDKAVNEPVPASEILGKTHDTAVSNQLLTRNSEIGLSLQSVGDSVIPEDTEDVNQVLILQILLGVVALVLGSLLLLLIITYFMRTRSLERRLKVATTTTFGSVSSDLNRLDMTGKVPGSNQFSGESANPMYNLSEEDVADFGDSSSVGSGDSVLVGVEDNPEFKSYYKSNLRNNSTDGLDNPAFSKSIDQVAAAPSFFDGGTRSNPLMDMDDGNDFDLSNGFQNHHLEFGRDSVTSGDSYGMEQNPNFSFGN